MTLGLGTYFLGAIVQFTFEQFNPPLELKNLAAIAHLVNGMGV